MFQRRQPRNDLAELFMRGQNLARIAIAVAGNEHLGLDLAEAVVDGADAEVR